MVRIKHRYLIAQMLLDPAAIPAAIADITAHDILSVIHEKISSLYGDVGAGNFGSGVQLKYLDQSTAEGRSKEGTGEEGTRRATHIFVLRCAREAEQQVRFAMCTVASIKHTALILRTLGVSGSSRTCAEKVRSTLCAAVDAWEGTAEKEKSEKKRRLLEGLQGGIA